MKSSLKKLRGLAAHHHKSDPSRDRRDRQASVQAEELAQASQDMQDMKDCYDGLLSAAAATANSAYEFSVALREMGEFLLQKIEPRDDEESSRVLIMLGRAQFELQKLVDRYRSHIMHTITTPSVSLLNELRTVEEMKRQCDEKREVFNYMLAANKEKGKSRNSKGESFSSQQLLAAKEEYDQEATLFIFRLKSLKQGQSRSLLTQAARHHAAQLNFFQKGKMSLEAVDPHVKMVSNQQHIDYQFKELEDDGIEDNDDSYSYEANDEGELSFDRGQFEQGQEVISASRNSMELDQTDYTPAPVSTSETTKDSLDKNSTDLFSFRRAPRPGSQSAPLFPEKKIDPSELIKEMRPSYTRNVHTYVLPTPADGKRASSASDSNPASLLENKSSCLGPKWPLWHSSPMGQDRNARDSCDSQLSGPAPTLKVQPVVKENKTNNEPIRLPPPLSDELFLPRPNPSFASDSKKIKRQAFSGPLISKAWSSKPILSMPAVEHPLISSMPMQIPLQQRSTSPKVSPGASPPLTSPPKISELHELPRPPPSLSKTAKSYSLVGHSEPLMFRGPENSTSKMPYVSTHVVASPLPMPPSTMARSFSIPSRGQRLVSISVSKLKEADKSAEISSPPLTPISLTNVCLPSRASEQDAQGTNLRRT